MILITGATGLVGRQLVRRLMQEQVPLRCLLSQRQLQRLPWDEQHVHAPEITSGSILEQESLFRAATGCHAIIHLASAQWWGRPGDLVRVEVAGIQELVVAARAARVGRIIMLSHIGAASSSAYALHRTKGVLEDMLRDSGVAYTIIRSGIAFGPDDAFVNHIASMLRINPLLFLMPGYGEVVMHPIYIDDLVEAIYRSLNLVRLVDVTVEIGGPEYLSLRDMISTIMRVTRMRRVVVPVPPYLLRWITAIYSRLLPRSLMTSQWLDILATNRTAPLASTYNNFGFHPRRFEDTLLSYLPMRRHFLGLLRDSFRRRPRPA